MTDRRKSDGGAGPGSGSPAGRGERLAAALRDNLHRRKAQARARRSAAGPETQDDAPEPHVPPPGEAPENR